MTTPTPQEQWAEFETLFKTIKDEDNYSAYIKPLAFEIYSAAQAKLLERLRVAEADAARYRWLKASDWYIGNQPERASDTYFDFMDQNDAGLDDVIDAAIAKEQS